MCGPWSRTKGGADRPRKLPSGSGATVTPRREFVVRLVLVALGSAVGLAGAEFMLRAVHAVRYADRPVYYPRDAELETYARGSLSRLQRELLSEGVTHMARVAGERDVWLLLHTAIHDAPSWHLEAIAKTLAAQTTAGSVVSWCGPVPVARLYDGPVLNEHSGSHFTPGLNAHYADRIAAWLLTGGCADGADTPG